MISCSSLLKDDGYFTVSKVIYNELGYNGDYKYKVFIISESIMNTFNLQSFQFYTNTVYVVGDKVRLVSIYDDEEQ
jgi:hypothetical protein